MYLNSKTLLLEIYINTSKKTKKFSQLSLRKKFVDLTVKL